MNSQTRFSLLLFFSVILVSSQTAAQDTIIDLTRVDFTQPRLYALSGKWEFYWNQLLTPEDFKSWDHQKETLRVPGGWNRQANYPALGIATYRIKIKLSNHNNGLAIYFPIINSAARIFINGEKVAETGVVSTNEKLYLPKLSSTIVEVPAHQSEFELVVQCANYTYFSGGISGTPEIGKVTHLLSQLNQSQGIENFFAGSLIAMWIYQLILFFLFHRGKPYLWLSMICLGVALRALIVHGGSFLLPNLYPSVSWETWKKIEFESVYSMASFFPLYVFHLFREDAPRWPIKFFIATSTLLCVTVLLTPQYIYGRLLEVSHIALLLSFIYAIYSVGKAWKNGNKDARTIFFGVLASFPFILAEILKNSAYSPFNVQFMYLVEMGVLMFLLFQVYLLANHYAKSYKNLEALNLNLEKMVEERSGELITANRVKDRLLSVVSHDIKSPLNSLRGILHIYNKGAISKEEFTNYSKRIEDDLGKTGLLVDNILYWTTSQLKGLEVKSEKLDLKDLLIENIELFRTIADNKKVSIQNNLSEHHVVKFDRDILNLTLRNLISNAIKFSHEGGEIIIHAVHTNEASAIQIIDYGVGMSDEMLRSLEYDETTLSTAGTSNEKGTGLGLSFCREYLQKAGAELKIDSMQGKGSTFTISIPK